MHDAPFGVAGIETTRVPRPTGRLISFFLSFSDARLGETLRYSYLNASSGSTRVARTAGT
jgi:hypothetical protein